MLSFLRAKNRSRNSFKGNIINNYFDKRGIIINKEIREAFDYKNEIHLKGLAIKNYNLIKNFSTSGFYSIQELFLIVHVLTYISVVEKKNFKFLFFNEMKKENECVRFFKPDARTKILSVDRELKFCMRVSDGRDFVKEIINKDFINNVEAIVKGLKISKRAKAIFFDCCFNGGTSEELTKKYASNSIHALGAVYRCAMLKVRNELGIKVLGCRHIKAGNLDSFKVLNNEKMRRYNRKKKMKKLLAKVN